MTEKAATLFRLLVLCQLRLDTDGDGILSREDLAFGSHVKVANLFHSLGTLQAAGNLTDR